MDFSLYQRQLLSPRQNVATTQKCSFLPKASWRGSTQGNPHIKDWEQSCSAPAKGEQGAAP